MHTPSDHLPPTGSPIPLGLLIRIGQEHIAHMLAPFDVQGDLRLTFTDGTSYTERDIAHYQELFSRSVLHTAKDLSAGQGASESTLLNPQDALRLLQTLGNNRELAEAYHHQSCLLRMNMFCTAFSIALEVSGVSKNAVERAYKTPKDWTYNNDSIYKLQSALGRIKSLTEKYSGCILYPQFEGKIGRNGKPAHSWLIPSKKERAISGTPLHGGGDSHRRLIRDAHEQSALEDVKSATGSRTAHAPVSEPTGTIAPQISNHMDIDPESLRTNYKNALNAYRKSWQHIDDWGKGRNYQHFTRIITDTPSQAPYMRLGHEEFLTKMDKVLDNVKELGLTLPGVTLDMTAKNNPQTLIGKLIAVKRAHYALSEARRDLALYDIPPESPQR